MGRLLEVFDMSVFLVLSAVLAIVVVGTMISVSVSFCGVILSTTDLVAINLGGGEKKHSVFDAIPSRPICMSSPNLAKWWYIRFIPFIMSSCVSKGIALLSTYRH